MTWNDSYTIGNMVLKASALATTFPRMPEAEFEELKADIKAYGMRDPVIYTDTRGKVLDGWHRVRVASELGWNPTKLTFQKYPAKDALAFVISRNMRRRHLSETQRATIAAQLSNTTKSESAIIGNGGMVEGKMGTKAAAQVMNVSERSVKRAKRVLRENPGVKDKLLSGEAKLTAEEDKLLPPKLKRQPKMVGQVAGSEVVAAIKQHDMVGAGSNGPVTAAAPANAAPADSFTDGIDDMLAGLGFDSGSGQSAQSPSVPQEKPVASTAETPRKVAALTVEEMKRLARAKDGVTILAPRELDEFASWFRGFYNCNW